LLLERLTILVRLLRVRAKLAKAFLKRSNRRDSLLMLLIRGHPIEQLGSLPGRLFELFGDLKHCRIHRLWGAVIRSV
jgi:hypothetical protein